MVDDQLVTYEIMDTAGQVSSVADCDHSLKDYVHSKYFPHFFVTYNSDKYAKNCCERLYAHSSVSP